MFKMTQINYLIDQKSENGSYKSKISVGRAVFLLQSLEENPFFAFPNF